MLWVHLVRWDGTEASYCELTMILKLAEAINVPQVCSVWTGLGCSCKLEADSLEAGPHLARVGKGLSLGTLGLGAWGPGRAQSLSLSCCSALALSGPRGSCLLPVFSEVWYFKCFDILNLCWIHSVCLIPPRLTRN